MPSTNDAHPEPLNWRAAGYRYYSFGFFLRRRFGQPVRKISIDAGFGCPHGGRAAFAGQAERLPLHNLPANIHSESDHTEAVQTSKRCENPFGEASPDSRHACDVPHRGCIFCNPESFSPSRRGPHATVPDQITSAAQRLTVRYGVASFIAYFQPGTNTHAPVELLRQMFEAALNCPGVVGLAIGTRPDCVGDTVLDLLAELSQRTFLTLELGVQTFCDRSLDWLGRGHSAAANYDALRRAHAGGVRTTAHVILGLPGESMAEMLHTANSLAELGVHGVKLHQLYAAAETPLAADVAAGRVELCSFETYVDAAVQFLERLPADCVVERLQADVPREYLVAPDWAADGRRVRTAIEAELKRRDTWQGKLA